MQLVAIIARARKAADDPPASEAQLAIPLSIFAMSHKKCASCCALLDSSDFPPRSSDCRPCKNVLSSIRYTARDYGPNTHFWFTRCLGNRASPGSRKLIVDDVKLQKEEAKEDAKKHPKKKPFRINLRRLIEISGVDLVQAEYIPNTEVAPLPGQEKVWQALRRRQGKGGGEGGGGEGRESGGEGRESGGGGGGEGGGGGGEGRERNRAPCKASAFLEERGMASAACLEEGGIPSDARAQNLGRVKKINK